jgi:hypothetical protein
MNDSELRELLLLADATAPAREPDCASIDVAGIRDRARRTTLHHRTVIVSIAAVAGITAFFASRPRYEPRMQTEPTIAQHRPLSPVEIELLKHEIAALDAEALGAQTLVDRLRHADRLAAIGDESTVAPITTIDSTPGEQIDRAAGIGVISADFLANDLHRAAEAAESYRSVLKHFPESRWAAVARERLSQIDMMN